MGGATSSANTGGAGGTDTGGTDTGGAAGADSGGAGGNTGSSTTEGTGGVGGAGPAPVCPERTSTALSEPLGTVGADGFSVWTKLASEIETTGIPTVGIVRWAAEDVIPTEAHIEFGLDSSYGMIAPVNLDCPDFRTALVGLKPERTYHYRIVASDGSTSYASDDHTLLTGPAPADFPLTELEVSLPEELERGYFIGSFWTVATPATTFTWTAYIVDSDGDLVWWHTALPESPGGEEGYARVRLSADNQDVWIVRVRNGGGPLIRVGIDTLEAQTYDDVAASHDIVAVTGQTMAYLDYSSPGRDCTGFSEIDKDGTTRPIFDIEAALGLTSCHANSLQYVPGQDVYALSIHQDDVVVVDREGQVDWRLAEKVSGGNASWGAHQHGVQLLDDGILIFANETEQGSQALEFALDGSLRRSIPAPVDFRFLGNAQRLPDGNTLVGSGYSMHVVTPADEVALEMTFNSTLGYLEFRSSLYEADE